MYDYERQKPKIFSEEGQRMFLKIRDNVEKLLEASGCVRMQEAMSVARGGDTWDHLACVDRLVELGEIREVERGGVAGQHRIFESARSN